MDAWSWWAELATELPAAASSLCNLPCLRAIRDESKPPRAARGGRSLRDASACCRVSRLVTEPRPSVTRFVNAVARAEGGGGADDLDVAKRIMKRLYQQLSKLVGPAGFEVLLARSIVLARRTHPALSGITAGAGGSLQGVDDAARDRLMVQGGALAIAEHFVELLAVLIGEDLAMRLLRDVWPGVAEEHEK